MLLAHLIQAGYYGHPSGFFYGMSAGTMGSWILDYRDRHRGLDRTGRLQSVFAKYAQVPFPGGLTGAEVAEKMLHDNGIRNVKVTHVAGHLTDHFNPQTMTVNLSDSVYASRSVAAAAVAAHECGHAVQHARGYAPLELRSQLVPIVHFASSAATWVLIRGMILAATQNELGLLDRRGPDRRVGGLLDRDASGRVQRLGACPGVARDRAARCRAQNWRRRKEALVGGTHLPRGGAERHRHGPLLRLPDPRTARLTRR